MKKSYVKKAAQNWLEKYRENSPGLAGAYVSGSYLAAAEDAQWPESSDVDIMLVWQAGACPPKLGKLREQGVLLEISSIEETEFQDLPHVLSTHYLAYALQAGEILYDPQGTLSALHQQVREAYAKREWVEARCESFYRRIREAVAGYRPEGMSFAQKANGWAFTTAIACFPILLANLENCTVRKRYPAARQVLKAYGMEGFYPRLLSLLVPEPLGKERLLTHMDGLEKTFSLACASTGPSAGCPFRQDISQEGAAVAIGGSRELLDTEYPEDAVFWMLATFARCHIILDMDNPALSGERLPAFQAFLADLGISREEDIASRLQSLAAFLPDLEKAAGEIIDQREKQQRLF
ncbi:hypothetical protein [Acutalibacter sp. JLR.KK004]|uniref:hypothetical protein n=1 Tax=Acutalibacter sp. JLR.KK004 TaxID=3112622 RepID=UPI002FF2ACAC